MQEIVLKNKKHGMAMLLTIILLFILSTAVIIYGAVIDRVEFTVPGFLLMMLALLLTPGLKVLRPQEALVLTLFGKYVGTLKGEGFYFVNPFCAAVNPAAKTKLNQSGDVTHSVLAAAKSNPSEAAELANKKISLKIMTLNNNRQKINDCLGNPVEIGIAVMWKVVDTAKAVFNVDNYKEYLSLQCDSALRNIVRIYPYDVAARGGHDGRRNRRRREPARFQRSGGGENPRRNSVPRERSGHRSAGSENHLSRLCARNRGGDVTAPAGVRDHRREKDDCRRRGGHGGNGPGTAERKQRGHIG